MNFRDMMLLEPHGPDTFVATGPRYPWGGLYGGQIVAQALRAAMHTVEPAFVLHSLHAFFIRLGDATEPIRLEVDRIRNGRSFLTRRVVARQSGGAILNMAASFQIPEEGPEIQTRIMPAVVAPEALTLENWSRMVKRAFVNDPALPATGWMKIDEPLGDDPALHACGLAYLSDDLPTDAVVARHPDRAPAESGERRLWNASLDHAIWFHHPPRADDFLLFSFDCHGFISSRGLSIGAVFDRGGRHVATVAQEVLTRVRRDV